MRAPSIKMRMVETSGNKISRIGCKWSNSIAPTIVETQLFHPLLGESLFLIFSSGLIRNGSPQYKDQDGRNIWEHNQQKPLQMVQLECPKYRNLGVSFIFWLIPFSHFQVLGNKK